MLAWQVAGPGRESFLEDRTGVQMRRATRYADDGRWQQAAAAYQAAQQELPASAAALRRRLRFAEAQALAQAGQLDTSRKMLQDLLDEMENDPAADRNVQDRVRHELATASYYGAWRMRLEGRADGDWRPLAHHARREFRTLADAADRQAIREPNVLSTDAHRLSAIYRRNLEATIKMEYMHLMALQDKKLPEIYAHGLDVSPPDSAPDPASSESSSESVKVQIPTETHIQ
jgi:tetratricopeptide (TPR) repeat protein